MCVPCLLVLLNRHANLAGIHWYSKEICTQSECSNYRVLVLQDGRTALMLASWRGDLNVVMELLAGGAKVDTQDQVCISRTGVVSMHCL